MAMMNRPNKKNISFQQVLAALIDEKNVFPALYLHHFSDLEGPDLEALVSIWPQIPATRRFTLLEDLEDLAEVDTLVSFDNVARFALNDEDPRVRTVAVRLLGETEDKNLVPIFLKMLNEDASIDVRAAAATALGLFVYLGELEEIPETILRQVEENLLAALNSPEETLVRRRALESLGFSGRKEVPPLLKQAYEMDDSDWQASALFAMGRSADQAWGSEIIRMLRHPKLNVQIEAIRAAGELALDSARRPLLRLLESDPDDVNLRQATVWSLSQIGGEEVREALDELLEETEDEEELEFLENALDNLTFTDDLDNFSMFDFDKFREDDADSSLYPDLEEEEPGSEDEDIENKDDSAAPSTKAKKRHRHNKSTKGE